MVRDIRDVYICTFLIYVHDVVDNLRIVFLLISSAFVSIILVVSFSILTVVCWLRTIFVPSRDLRLLSSNICGWIGVVTSLGHRLLWLVHLNRVILRCIVCVIIGLISFHVNLVSLAWGRCSGPWPELASSQLISRLSQAAGGSRQVADCLLLT